MASAVAELPPELLEYLQILRSDQVPHSGRTLLEHLAGTYSILQSWSCPPAVGAAGLFHSVYGTNVFALRRLDVADRSLVVRMIGAQAERLVYLFCVSNRPDAFLEAFDTGVLRHRDTGELISVEAEALGGLIEIECANLIEQGSGQRFLRDLFHWAQVRAGAGLRPQMLAALAAAHESAAPAALTTHP
ncbi:hypothetical protein JR065_10580 [Xanthomonas sp. AmX2]|uniref:DUF6817 domain-containing protein n=1 Tax=Xanthomonas sp. TaxID=29446 RepID=UPI00197E9381|nr:hypothetical protein [Xanthomonas sp.]MBN6150788.1 hypothetical protein [Xanthomonas sp.]